MLLTSDPGGLMANKKGQKVLATVRIGDMELYEFLDWGEYEIKLVSVRRPRQSIIISKMSVLEFAKVAAEIADRVKY
jgi:hypothetical protein